MCPPLSSVSIKITFFPNERTDEEGRQAVWTVRTDVKGASRKNHVHLRKTCWIETARENEAGHKSTARVDFKIIQFLREAPFTSVRTVQTGCPSAAAAAAASFVRKKRGFYAY